jgi:hypothetical protein
MERGDRDERRGEGNRPATLEAQGRQQTAEETSERSAADVEVRSGRTRRCGEPSVSRRLDLFASNVSK